MKHDEWELLSAFLDEELAAHERAQVEAHLSGCSECSQELRSLGLMKKTAASAPRRSLPPALLARLEAELSEPTWSERLRHLLRTPRIAVPIGAAAALAAGLLLWTAGPEREEIPLEPLIAAHMRYSAEGLVPREGLSHPEFTAYLVADNAH